MRLFSEPESWIGLRSERAVAVEFGRPAAPRPIPPRPMGDAAAFSWREVSAVMRRTMAMLLGR
jgi:hypothetical protein